MAADLRLAVLEEQVVLVDRVDMVLKLVVGHADDSSTSSGLFQLYPTRVTTDSKT